MNKYLIEFSYGYYKTYSSFQSSLDKNELIEKLREDWLKIQRGENFMFFNVNIHKRGFIPTILTLEEFWNQNIP